MNLSVKIPYDGHHYPDEYGWLFYRGLQTMPLQRLYNGGDEFSADSLGFPLVRQPGHERTVFTRAWCEGSFKQSHWWFNFPPGFEAEALMFKLTFGGV
jgi:hypothetical protein